LEAVRLYSGRLGSLVLGRGSTGGRAGEGDVVAGLRVVDAEFIEAVHVVLELVPRRDLELQVAVARVDRVTPRAAQRAVTDAAGRRVVDRALGLVLGVAGARGVAG